MNASAGKFSRKKKRNIRINIIAFAELLKNIDVKKREGRNARK